ncbi:MAG: PAS domain S-box protein [Methanobacteriota archaeon]
MSTQSKKEEKNQESYIHQDLVVGIKKNGEVIHFNKGCEQLTGLSREEVLYKNLADIAIPEQYRPQWNQILHMIKSQEEVDDFVIPWITLDGTETVILWSYLTHNDSDSAEENIYFTGKQIRGYKPLSTPPPHPVSEPVLENQTPDDDQFSPQTPMNDVLVFTFGNKRIKLRKKPLQDTESSTENVLFHQIEELKKTITQNSKDLERLSETVAQVKEEPPQKDIVNEQQQKTPDVTPEEEVFFIDTQNHEEPSISSQIFQKTEVISSDEKKQSEPTTKRIRFSSRPSKKEKKWEEIEHKTQELAERERLLRVFESQLLEEKKTLENNKAAFQKWREKLEQLEGEIERRRLELVREENAFRERMFAQHLPAHPSEISVESNNTDDNHHTVLDKIPESAVVLQRGIVKQANSPFTALLGYSSEEVQDKRFYDFIDPEELRMLEQYLLNRLKGEEISSYDTVFFTKTKQKISVTVSVKSTLYNGEHADLVVIKIANK